MKTKTATEVVQAYVDKVYAKFGESVKILSDNGTEFKNQLFMDVATHLRVECIRSTPLLTFHSQTKELEGFITFLKHTCLNMYQNLFEWDEVVPIAYTAYDIRPG